MELPVFSYSRRIYLVVCKNRFHACQMDSSVVLQTLIICAGIASAGVFLAVRHSTRPLRELNAAIRHVARGDFEVRVDYRGRDEMGVVVQNFNWMVGELRNIEYLRKDFVSSVSHEFKTPVSAIRGSVKLLTATPFEKLNEAKFRKYMGLIADETERMSSLSSNLLRLSRLENQSAAENVINFSLDEQLRRCIFTFGRTVEHKTRRIGYPA